MSFSGQDRLRALQQIRWFDRKSLPRYQSLLELQQHPWSGISFIDDVFSNSYQDGFQVSGSGDLRARNSPPIIEIYGPPGSGKTMLGCSLCTRIILPKSLEIPGIESGDGGSNCSSIPLNGKEMSVIFMDLDGKFDINCIRDIIRRHLIKSIQAFFKTTSLNKKMIQSITAATTECLHRFVLFRPQNTTELIACLSMVPQHLEENKVTSCPFMVIDGIHSWTLVDKTYSQLLKNPTKNASPWYSAQLALMQTLKMLVKAMHLSVLVAHGTQTYPINPTKVEAHHSTVTDSSGSVYIDRLVPKWKECFTHSFVFSVDRGSHENRDQSTDGRTLVRVRSWSRKQSNDARELGHLVIAGLETSFDPSNTQPTK
ncbi:hypothetical protein H4219_004266 [Mycoemilia scoparia]|uniref:RecA family profile 1 domain-containing protein n=1 Tax=Mycoemilia scoparia TaxID=417184 RepID=A0A9W8DLQ6_9FUNG|nr:hypothetical protein H4219_004266 [Mycoemilia scoparia]